MNNATPNATVGSKITMDLLYISALETNAGWGAEGSVNQALRRLGVNTTVLDFRRNRWRLSEQFLDLPPFDALLLQRGDYFPVKLVEACRTPRFFWASELVSRRRDQRALLKSGLFDHIFVRTPSCKQMLIELDYARPNQVSVLLSAYDGRLHRPLPQIEKSIDVLFIGSPSPRRESILRRLTSHFDVEVKRGVFGGEMVRLFNQARIVLNIHATEYLDTETRVFEALGCGSFVLSEPMSEECPFENGVHLITAEYPAAMENALAYYLEHEDEREEIANRGHLAASREHTYEVRARTILRTIQHHVGFGTPPQTEALNYQTVREFRRREPAFNCIRLLHTTLEKILGRLRRVLNKYASSFD